jgi:hypothetical protein
LWRGELGVLAEKGEGRVKGGGGYLEASLRARSMERAEGRRVGWSRFLLLVVVVVLLGMVMRAGMVRICVWREDWCVEWALLGGIVGPDDVREIAARDIEMGDVDIEGARDVRMFGSWELGR